MQGLDGNWVTVEQAARTLGIDAAMVRDWARAGSVGTFREGPSQRFVRLDEVREAVYAIRGRPRGSLLQMIASNEAAAGRPNAARISELQDLIRERLHA